MNQLLERIALTKPFEQVIKSVLTAYDLGKLINYSAFERGYEDANFKLQTTKGNFVLKIFSKEKNLQQNQDYINGLLTFVEAEIPVPHLLFTQD